MQKLKNSYFFLATIFCVYMCGGATLAVAASVDQPYYSRFGRVVSEGQGAYATFITDNPDVSAAVIAALEGALVGLYLYKIAPGKKVSGREAIGIAVRATIICFITRFFMHHNRSANAGPTFLRPVTHGQAASVPLEVAVRSASLLWGLFYEAWWLSTCANMMKDAGNRDDEFVNTWILGPFLRDPITVVAHELGHGIVNRMITGSPFKIFLGQPTSDQKQPLFSENIFGVPVTVYRFNPFLGMGGRCECARSPVSTAGRIAMLAAGPVGGIVGNVAFCGAQSLVSEQPFVSTLDRFFMENVFWQLNNLLNPVFNGAPGLPSDAAQIFNALGINP